ncbi:ubiquinone/menaquinone biosynthesis methyltransferase ubiE [Phlyctochytrium arcticum]|nr:ubiquinone/menaquinone biosynthesis methyltransferase ubiE [Phlyctochytrium arcticum]
MQASRIRYSRIIPQGLLQRCQLHSVPALRKEAPTLSALKTDNVEPPSEPTTHFGFQTVREAEKETLVGKVFGNVASSYDLMNDVMSGGVHRLWKDHFVRTLAPGPNTRILDVAGGTGDIAFRLLDYVKANHPNHNAHVTVVDINPAMLENGMKRAPSFGHHILGPAPPLPSSSDPSANPIDSLSAKPVPHLSFQVGNAENLHNIPDESVDAFTIAFGIRNCTHVDRVLKEAHRVLKKGGRFMCLEFGNVENPIVARFYDVYSFQLIPKMGELVANDRESYQYLVESIRKFPAQPVFAQMIRDAGFTVVGQGWEDLTFGVAAIHSGFKL